MRVICGMIGAASFVAGCESKATQGSSTATRRDEREQVEMASPDRPAHVELPARFRGLGRSATTSEIRAWNIDVNPSGEGLPRGSGTYARGTAVFAAQCAACHGPHGEGLAGNPRLIGAEPRDFSFAHDYRIPRTIGNYWPYATTLYDYINRAMPFPAPGTLQPNDVYSVIAFLLAENGVVPRSTIIDARSLPKVRMPGQPHFVMDDRVGGAGFR